MKTFNRILTIAVVGLVCALSASSFAQQEPSDSYKPNAAVMSPKYFEFWNADVQAKIDADIEKNRKANAVVELPASAAGAEIKVEQITHKFRFGSNMFVFGQLRTPELNDAYKSLFGDLWNSGTVAFYWKTLEFEQGRVRFEGNQYDTPEYWANSKDPKQERHWRRPPTDRCVDFLNSKGLYVHGHAMIYGMRRWGHPDWAPEDRKELEKLFEEHIKLLCQRYGDRVQEWDVVNECIDQANRGIMPDDYTYKCFKWAEKYLPASVRLSTNECDMSWGPNRRYVEIVRDLVDRGAKVDLMGVQKHFFNPKAVASIANGADSHTPAFMYSVLDCMAEAERPIHISEITIPVPTDDARGRDIQAVVAYNLYRLWFSYPNVEGITWWNSIDGGGAPGEPTTSGVLDVNGEKKPVYYALDQLINHDWKTTLKLKADETGKIAFRGFKGEYELSWTGTDGKTYTKRVQVH
ncbi:MAG: endo-1,4-beta-xylanase [Thermoguttaceae bacterium]|nr:endo-1,4-beta-xylanase [Thermoguttaceae bacterium]